MKVFDVFLLSRTPGRLRHDIGVRTTLDNGGHIVAESGTDVVKSGSAALIFDGIVQETGDRFVFFASILDDEGAYGQ